jgi:hypothetical protein
VPWETVISVGGSLLGGALGGGSKAAERAAKDAAARAQNAQDQARRDATAALNPYMQSGENANRLLSQLLGTADPEGYAPKPTRQQFVDERRNAHFNYFGQDYNRNSNMGGVNQTVDRLYKEALAKWEAGKKDYIANNPGSQGDGSLLRNFTNEDFVKDPGYEFRLAEGEKGTNRALAARGSFDSGAALKSLERFRQDYASNEFGNAYNRDAANKARTFGFLSGEKGTGMSAASALTGVGQSTANNIGNIGMQTAQQVGQMQQDRNMTYANALQGAIGNLVYGMNRPRDSGVTSVPSWSTPGINGSASNRSDWWNDSNTYNIGR